ncbi:hypothetical protein [Streptomyces griseus]|uniref:hypothetical protein n=1 Tax=Streptomyces griseus TaxID=1911 RepID=UPI000A9F76FB|nr:hypothetical protein [Streptomyces griseus]
MLFVWLGARSVIDAGRDGTGPFRAPWAGRVWGAGHVLLGLSFGAEAVGELDELLGVTRLLAGPLVVAGAAAAAFTARVRRRRARREAGPPGE